MGHPILTKTCPGCGRTFLTREVNKVYCSAMCEEESDPNCRQEYNLKPDVICRMCGRHFMQEHFNQKYCSPKCVNQARIISKRKYNAAVRRL